MAKLPVRKKAKKTGGPGNTTNKPAAPKLNAKKSFKKKNVKANQSLTASTTKPGSKAKKSPKKKNVKNNQSPKAPPKKNTSKATPSKTTKGPSGNAKPEGHKRRRRGGVKGRGGRRVRPAHVKVKRVIQRKQFMSGEEKDNKLMRKFTALAQESPAEKKKTDTKVDPKELINLDMLRAAITGLRKLPASGKNSEKKSLHDITDEDERPVFLQVTLCKLPKVSEDMHIAGPTTVNVHLPHSLVTDNTDVILITKDLQRGVKKDHQNTLDHFKELLHSKGAASLVSEVIPLRQLKVEYKEFEAKRLLANRTEVLLCDDSVVRLLPRYLSKHFYVKKKLPVQVDLKAENLKKEVQRALSVSRLFFSMKGNSSIMKVGRMCQSDENIEENVLEAVRKLAVQGPGEWNNIQSLSLKLESTESVPLYIRMESLNTVKPLPAKRIYAREIVAGTLSTQPGRCITVFPDLNVTTSKLKKNKKRIAEAERATATGQVAKTDNKQPEVTASKKKAKKAKSTPSENGTEGTPEIEETESSKAKEKTKKAPKRKAAEKKTTKAKKQKKGGGSDSDSDSGDDDLEEQELMYLKQLSQKGDDPANEKGEDDDSEIDVWGESDSDMDDSE